MAVGIQKAWSVTALSNGSADTNINFAENQSPASLNDSARAMMAALKGFANQITGAKTTGGSSSAYTYTSDTPAAISAAYAAGMGFVFKANHTNTGASTLNVDGVGAKAIRKGGAHTALAANDIVANGIYAVFYEASADLFVLINPDTGVAGAGQPLDATLTALAALSYTSGTLILTMTAADTFALVNDNTFVHIAGTETITGNKTISGTLTIAAATPLLYISETDQGADGKLSRIQQAGGVAAWVWRTDADGSGGIIMTATRSGTSTASMALGAVPTVGGVTLLQAGKIAVPIPASAMVPNTTNGAAQGTTETSTNKVMIRTLDFDTTTQEGAQFSIPMPKGWNEGTVTFEPIWTADSGSGGVVWELRAVALSNDDALDTAFGTGQTSTDTLIAAGDVHIGPESAAITIGGSPAEGDMVFFQIRRVPANGSDTLGVDARLLGIRLYITTNAANDA